MGERVGQLLRQDLQARLDYGDAPAAKRYDLAVDLHLSSEGLGVQPDTTVTRIRMSAYADWALVKRDATRATLTTGTARISDGYNVFDQQYFAQDIETDTVERRMFENLADQITQQLGAWFDKHPA
jgi:LPS-assembly lipoprotein